MLFFYEYIGETMDNKKYILKLSNEIKKIARKDKIDILDHNNLQEMTTELHSLLESSL